MTKVVIIGGGHAAAQCVLSLKQAKFDGCITLITEEADIPYQRPPLSKAYLKGELLAERLPIHRQKLYDDMGVDLRLSCRVDAIHREAKTIQLSDGEVVAYDKLIIATGGRARPLPVPGGDLPGVFTVRTKADIEKMQPVYQAAQSIVIIGGGYIGLEVAAVASAAGKQVVVLEAKDRLLKRVTAAELSAFYQTHHQSKGVKIYTGEQVTSLTAQSDGGVSVQTVSGTEYSADCVVVGIGLIANSELAVAAGLDASQNGIVVNDFCQTSDPAIYAVGDVTWHHNIFYDRWMRLESVQNAVDQAKVAVAHLMGVAQAYDAQPWFWSDQYDLKLQMVGLNAGYDDLVIRGQQSEGKFACFYLKNGVVIAADCVGSMAEFMGAKKLIASKTPVTAAALMADKPFKEVVAELLATS